MENIVFNNQWFSNHQKKLLWLLNAPIIKIWFRYVLRIRRCDCSLKERIVQIQPNNYKVSLGLKWAKGKGIQEKIRADFRTHDKYSKRLYFAFKPLWYLFHIIDWVAFDRYEQLTKLSFGFSTLTQYPGTTSANDPVDGYVKNGGGNNTWSNMRSGAGTASGYTDSQQYFFYWYTNTSAPESYNNLTRSIFCFDTSSLTSGATISGATFSLDGRSKTDNASISPNADIYGATPAATNALANADYGQTGGTSFTGSPVAYSSLTANGTYTTFTFNSTGIAGISKTGISSFSCRNANFDGSGTAPGGSGAEEFWFGDFANQTGTTYDPKIVITYTIVLTSGNMILMF